MHEPPDMLAAQRASAPTWWSTHHQLVVIVGLAVAAALLQVLDGATAVAMMLRSGPQAELNPVVRGMFNAFGPAGVLALKLANVALVLPLLVTLGCRGRPLLARNCLGVSVLLGALGALSNLG